MRVDAGTHFQNRGSQCIVRWKQKGQKRQKGQKKPEILPFLLPFAFRRKKLFL